MKLLWRTVMDARTAEGTRRIHVGGDVVDVDGLGRVDLTSAQSFAEDERLRLAGTDRAGVDAHGLGEIAKERVSGFQMRDVDRVGVGKKAEPVRSGKALEKSVRMDWIRIESGIPDLGELLEIKGEAQPLGEIQMPITGRHAAFLPVVPARVLFNGGPKFLG